MKSWNKITETSKPEPGFVYSCENGHEWFIPFSNWSATRCDAEGKFLPNNCQECGDGPAGEGN